MQGNKLEYTEFTDRMIQAVQGESRYCEKVANTFFGSLVSPSQKAFTMLLYKNGFQKWVWMHNGSVSSEAGEASNGNTLDGSPGYIYTARTSDLTSINGGWSRMGMLKYNGLYKKEKENQLADNGAFDSEYMMHWVEKTSGARGSGGVTMAVNSEV